MPGPELVEVPAVASLLAAVGFALAWMAATGTLTVWRISLKRVLVYAANFLDAASVSILSRTVRPFGPIASLLRSLVNRVDRYLGDAVFWTEKGAATLFKFFLDMQLWLAREIAGLAQDTWAALQRTSVTTTNAVTKYVKTTVVQPITKQVTIVSKVGAAAARSLTRRITNLEKRVAHLVVIAGAAVVSPWPRIRGVERKIEAQAKRLGALERIGLGALAGTAVVAVTRRFGWVRCGNVGRVGRALCSTDRSLLDSLLSGSLLIVGTISLAQMARELHEPTELVMDGVGGLVRELREIG